MDFKLFDADNHYYEAEDAFTRYGDERVKRYVQWVNDGKRRHIMFGDRMSTGVPNPTFNPIAQAGCVPRTPEGAAGGQGRAQPQRVRHPSRTASSVRCPRSTSTAKPASR